VAVFQLFATLITFIRSEKQKSSTEMLKNVVDEWESLFAREVNVVLFKSYYQLTHDTTVQPESLVCYEALLERLMPTMELLDYSFVYGVIRENICLELFILIGYLSFSSAKRLTQRFPWIIYVICYSSSCIAHSTACE